MTLHPPSNFIPNNIEHHFWVAVKLLNFNFYFDPPSNTKSLANLVTFIKEVENTLAKKITYNFPIPQFTTLQHTKKYNKMRIFSASPSNHFFTMRIFSTLLHRQSTMRENNTKSRKIEVYKSTNHLHKLFLVSFLFLQVRMKEP